MDNNKTILILEDDEGTARLEQIHLQMAGYKTEIAHTTYVAEEILHRIKVDLLLLDYNLSSGVTGLDFYKQLKAQGIDLPVILATVLTDRTVIVAALREGVADFVNKQQDFLDSLPEAAHRVLAHTEMKMQLAESEASLSGIIHSAMDAIFSINTKGEITLFNPAAETTFQCTAGEAMGKPATSFLPSWDEMEHKPEQTRLFAPAETTGTRANGETFPAEASISEIKTGRNLFHTVMLRDITERKNNESLLKEMALHDPLTGLSTRRHLDDRFNQALNLARRNKTKIAIFFLDLDRFKQVNDSLGHLAGDRLLKMVAYRLTEYLRRDNTVARVGGDEFVILLSNITDVQDIKKVALQVIETFSHPFELLDHALVVTTSLGVSLYPDDGNDAETLLKNADAAMYQAKQQGKNRFQFYNGDKE